MRDRCGEYRLEALIAKGGMAEVYRASRDGGDGSAASVCLKMVRAELSGDEEFAAMFRREAQIAAALQHPNIVRVLGSDEQEGRLFLAMEYVEGLDLRGILRQAHDLGLRVPVGFALLVAEGLLAALRCAHGHTAGGAPQPVVHRDVSPHNLLVSTRGHVKLADFGIAKALGATCATRTGVVKGKLAYLSPEQAAGAEVGPASDLFGAGLVLFEMLSGRRLNSGRSDPELLARALRPSVPELPSASPAIARFTARLLAAAPAARFESAGHAVDALAALRAETPYEPAEAGRLVEALLALRAEGGATSLLTPSSRGSLAPASGAEAGARPLADEPTRRSGTVAASPAPTARARRALSRPPVAIGLVAIVLGAGLAAGWLVGARQGTAEASAPVAAVKRETPAPVAAPAATAAAPAATAPPREGAPAPAAAEVAGAAIAPAPTAERAAKVGWLQVDCRPWADVALDGRPIGTTPISALRVAAGQHRVVLTNLGAGYREEIVVKVAPGETARVNRKVPGA